MTLLKASLIGAVAALPAGGAHAVTNLVTNGGFETGDLSGWSYDRWSVTNNMGSIAPQSGNYFATTECIHFCALAQDLVTTAGQFYTLRFAFNPGLTANHDADTYVTFDGAEVADMAGGALGWTIHSVIVKATGSSTALVFNGYQQPATNGLDNVSVIATPEPAAWATMLLGFGLAGGALRRRRGLDTF
jgi:hypothetical protein